MTTFDADRLMSLLPAVYRNRDAERGELRTLLTVVAREIAVVEEDLAQLYDDQFIETCADWVVPYIGDLLGTSPLYTGGGTADDRLSGLFPDLTGPRFSNAYINCTPNLSSILSFRCSRFGSMFQTVNVNHSISGSTGENDSEQNENELA